MTLASRLKDGPAAGPGLTRDRISSALDHAHRLGITIGSRASSIMLTASGASFSISVSRSSGLLRGGVAAADATRAEPIPARLNRPPSSKAATTLRTRGGVIRVPVRYGANRSRPEIDARAICFSFGVLLYEMLTGKRAFGRDSATSVRAAILERDPPPVSSLRPLIPRALDDIVRRCLAKDRDERWQTAGDLLRELKRVSESSNLAGTPVRKAWTWIAAILVTTIAGLGAWAIAGGFQRGSTAQPAGQIRSIAVLPLDNLSGDPDQEYR